MGREDKIELVKAQRVVEKRRGELLGPGGRGRRNDLDTSLHEGKLPSQTASHYRRIAHPKAWPVLEAHLLEATDLKQVSQRALLDLKEVLNE